MSPAEFVTKLVFSTFGRRQASGFKAFLWADRWHTGARWFVSTTSSLKSWHLAYDIYTYRLQITDHNAVTVYSIQILRPHIVYSLCVVASRLFFSLILFVMVMVLLNMTQEDGDGPDMNWWLLAVVALTLTRNI